MTTYSGTEFLAAWFVIMMLVMLFAVLVPLAAILIVTGVSASKPGKGFTPQGVPAELLEEQNIAVCIILSIVTLGIYQAIWYVRMCRYMRLLEQQDVRCVGEALCLVAVPFYYFYWLYTRGERLQPIQQNYGLRGTIGSSVGLIYLLLSLFGVGIAAFAIMQNDMNGIARRLQGR